MIAFLVGLMAASAAPEPTRVAVLFHSTADVAPAAAERMEGLVRERLVGMEGVRVQSQAETMLGIDQATAAGWQCYGAPACISELGISLGVDVVLTVTAGMRGTAPVLQLKSVDVATRLERASAEALLPEDSGAWPPAVDGALRIALARAGALQIRCRGCAAVSLDGQPVALDGGGAVVGGLAPGPHRLRATPPGGPPFDAVVDVTAGATAVWSAPQSAAAPQSRAPRFVAIGVAVVGAVAWVAAWLSAAIGIAASLGLVGALERDGGGRVVARAGQPRQLVEVQLYGGLGIGAGALVLFALGLLGLVTAAAGGVGALALFAFGRGEP